MRIICMAVFAAVANAQNFSVTAVADGVCDLPARFAFGVEPELRIAIPETQVTVLEVSLGNFVWSYLLPPAPTIFRDGFVERTSPQWPAELRIPLRLLPQGYQWQVRVLTTQGASDTLELRSYP